MCAQHINILPSNKPSIEGQPFRASCTEAQTWKVEELSEWICIAISHLHNNMLINIVIAGAKYNAFPLFPPSLISSHFPGLLSLVFGRLNEDRLPCLSVCRSLYSTLRNRLRGKTQPASTEWRAVQQKGECDCCHVCACGPTRICRIHFSLNWYSKEMLVGGVKEMESKLVSMYKSVD